MAHRTDLSRDDKRRAGWVDVAIGDVCQQVQHSVPVHANGSYPNVGIFSFGRGLFRKPPIEGMATRAKTLCQIRNGQFIYSKLFAFEGAYGIVTDEFDGSFVSSEYPMFECDRTRLRAEFLYAYFKSPRIWSIVAAGSKGLGDRRQRVQPDRLLSHRLMLPPLCWQERIASVLRRVQVLHPWQSEATAELEALLPAVLERAFREEL